MTIDTVTSSVRPTTTRPPDTLEERFGSDAWKLRMCAKWRALRAQQEKNWAEYDVASGWGNFPGSPRLWNDLDLNPLKQMKELQDDLARFEPGTVLLARELLGVCVSILAHQKADPESPMAHGPLLEIIRNVVRGLEHLDADTHLRLATDKSSE